MQHHINGSVAPRTPRPSFTSNWTRRPAALLPSPPAAAQEAMALPQRSSEASTTEPR